MGTETENNSIIVEPKKESLSEVAAEFLAEQFVDFIVDTAQTASKMPKDKLALTIIKALG